MTKSGREVMEILQAFDLTHCSHSAAKLAGVDEKTVARYVAARNAGNNPFVPIRRLRAIDPFMDKIEELVDKSKGEVRADVVHRRLAAMGFAGAERSTRRAVAEVKEESRPPAPVPSMDPGAGDVAAVRLGRGPPGGRAAHPIVLRMVVLVTVSGGDPDLGSNAGQLGGLHRCHAAAYWRGTDISIDRQPAHGDHRPDRPAR